MSSILKTLALACGATLTFIAPLAAEVCNPKTYDRSGERLIIANRGSGDLTVFDAVTNQVIKQSLKIPNSEPMYVVYVPQQDRIYVGDRKQSAVHVINPATLKVERTIAVGAEGVFHMWADRLGQRLWVVADGDRQLVAIDLASGSLDRAPIQLANKPHDVFPGPDGKIVYVSAITANPTQDKVIAYDLTHGEILASVSVPVDPHLFYVEEADRLFVASQGGQVQAFERDLTRDGDPIALTGAHGIYGANNGEQVFLTNIIQAKVNTLDVESREFVGAPVDTPQAKAHNLVSNATDSRLFVTHSGGTATSVSVYNVDKDGAASFAAELTAGVNPFGLAYYTRW